MAPVDKACEEVGFDTATIRHLRLVYRIGRLEKEYSEHNLIKNRLGWIGDKEVDYSNYRAQVLKSATNDRLWIDNIVDVYSSFENGAHDLRFESEFPKILELLNKNLGSLE
jgi:hypothetical protein